MFLFSGSKLKFLDEIILSLSLISPDLRFCRPAIVLRIVVFPTPDGPSKQTISPFFLIVKDTFLTLLLSLAINVALLIYKKL